MFKNELISLYAIISIWTIIIISPGPNFFGTTHVSVTGSRKLGIIFAQGILAGIILWVLASLIGIDLLLHSNAWLYYSFTIIGSIYLLYFGIKMFHSANRSWSTHLLSVPSVKQAFIQGIMVELSNPKMVLFFVTLFPHAISTLSTYWIIVLIFGFLIIAELWYILLASVAGHAKVSVYLVRWKHLSSYLSGIIFICFSIFMPIQLLIK